MPVSLVDGDTTRVIVHRTELRDDTVLGLSAGRAYASPVAGFNVVAGAVDEVVPLRSAPRHATPPPPGGGTGLWLPPTVPVDVEWSGTDFVYGPGSYAGGDLVVVYSTVQTAIGRYSQAVFKVPAGFHLVQVYGKPKTTVVGGTTGLEVGTGDAGSPSPDSILNGVEVTGILPGSGVVGVDVTDYGSDMSDASKGYTHVYLAGATFYINQEQADAPCTDGAFTFTFRGAVVP